MKKLTKLLLAGAMILPLGAVTCSKVSAAENGNVSVVIPAALVSKQAAENIDAGTVIHAGNKFQLENDGSISMELSPKLAAEAKKGMLAEMTQEQESVKERTGGSVEKVEISKDYTQVKAYASTDQLKEKDKEYVYVLAAQSAVYQAFCQVPASKIDVKLEFVSKDTGKAFSTLTLNDVINKLAAADCTGVELEKPLDSTSEWYTAADESADLDSINCESAVTINFIREDAR